MWLPPAERREGDGQPQRGPESGDLDGDGVVDILVWSGQTYGAIQPVVAALSGRTGKRLWTAELASRVSRGLTGLCAADLNGDGQSEVSLLIAMDLDYPVDGPFDLWGVQWWLVSLSGDTGRVLWRQPCSPAYGRDANPAGPPAMFPLASPFVRFPLLAADLDGDQLVDLVSPSLVDHDPSGRRIELRAFRGRDGAPLWNYPLEEESDLNNAMVELPAPAIYDLDNDQRAEVVVTQRVRPAGDDASSGNRAPRLDVLTGASGQLLWTWRGQQRLESARNGQRRGAARSDLSLPQLLTASDGKRHLALLISGSPTQIVLLDSRGQATTHELPWQTTHARLWSADTDRDGADELMFTAARTLFVTPGLDPTSPRWTHEFPHFFYPEILEVSHDGEQAELEVRVLAGGDDNALAAFDAATGRRRWSCAGPIPRAPGVNSGIGAAACLGIPDSSGPLVWYDYGAVHRCRQAAWHHADAELPVTRTVVYRERPAVAASFRAPARLTRPAHDPRWQRDLPWYAPNTPTSELLRPFVAYALWGLLIVVFPLGWLAVLIVRRRWSITSLAVLTALIGVAALSATSRFADGWAGEPHSPEMRLVAGIAATPPLAFFGLLAWWLARQRFRTGALWLIVSVLAAVVIATVFLVEDGHNAPRQVDEYYSWQGWWLVYLPAFYFTSCLCLGVTPLVALGRVALRRFRTRLSPLP